MNTIGPTLETERLILRPPQRDDMDAWVEFHADPVVMEHLGGVQGPELTWRAVCAMTGSWTINGFSMFSIIEKSSGQWIGRLGPWKPEGWPGTEIGWGLSRAAWGKGYATEISTGLLRFAFEEASLPEVVATHDKANVASRNVLLKSGFVDRGEKRLYGGVGPYLGTTRAEWLRFSAT